MGGEGGGGGGVQRGNEYKLCSICDYEYSISFTVLSLNRICIVQLMITTTTIINIVM